MSLFTGNEAKKPGSSVNTICITNTSNVKTVSIKEIKELQVTYYLIFSLGNSKYN